jgi:hypothetical protein
VRCIFDTALQNSGDHARLIVAARPDAAMTPDLLSCISMP